MENQLPATEEMKMLTEPLIKIYGIAKSDELVYLFHTILYVN